VLRVLTTLLQRRCLFSQGLFSIDHSSLWHVIICYNSICGILKMSHLSSNQTKKSYTTFFMNDVAIVCAITCCYLKMKGLNYTLL